MGMRILGKNCSTNYTSLPAPAPNPNPKRWVLLDKKDYNYGYVLLVKYLDCTNFEGEKIMVYKGHFSYRRHLDPHFTDSEDSPIARFKPNREGWIMACRLAISLGVHEQDT